MNAKKQKTVKKIDKIKLSKTIILSKRFIFSKIKFLSKKIDKIIKNKNINIFFVGFILNLSS